MRTVFEAVPWDINGTCVFTIPKSLVKQGIIAKGKKHTIMVIDE